MFTLLQLSAHVLSSHDHQIESRTECALLLSLIINLLQRDEAEISPSTLFAVASILEGSSYINGSPQNTFVPGVMELAEREGVFIVGDDFKSGRALASDGACEMIIHSAASFNPHLITFLQVKQR